MRWLYVYINKNKSIQLDIIKQEILKCVDIVVCKEDMSDLLDMDSLVVDLKEINFTNTSIQKRD
jgi:hypothetical protein